MKYAYSETESCASVRFPGSDLRTLSKSNLHMSRRNPVTTTDYGFIDLPFPNLRLTRSRTELAGGNENLMRDGAIVDFLPLLPDSCGLEDEGRSSISPTSSDVALKKLARDTSSTFSHDSGVDSMNTNSSGGLGFSTKIFEG